MNKINIRYFISVFSILIFVNNNFSQQTQIDSLKNLIDNSDEKKKLEILLELSVLYRNIDSKLVVEYGKNAFSLSQRLVDTANQIKALNNTGIGYDLLGDYKTSLEYYFRALNLAEKNNNKTGIASSLNNIGVTFEELSNYDKALENYQRALTIKEQINDKRGIAVELNNIGVIYEFKGDYKRALEYHKKALAIKEQLGDKESIAHSLGNIGEIDEYLGNEREAIKYYQRALSIREKMKDKRGTAISLMDIGNAYSKLGNYVKAAQYLEHSVSEFRIMHDKRLEIRALNLLAGHYKRTGNYKEALKYLEKVSTRKDSLFLDESASKIAEMQTKYETEKKKRENENLKKENTIQEAKITRQQITVAATVIGLFLVGLLALLFYRGRQNEKRINERLTEQNRKIEAQKEELNKLNATKDKFFSIIAHDLRSPFHTFLGLSGILAEEIDALSKEEIVDYSKELNISLQKQYALLNDLLDWSKLQTSDFTLNSKDILLCDILNEVIDQVTLQASKKGIEIKKNVAKDTIVFADVNMLKLVLRNLISNGIKFTNKNGLIEISATKKDGLIEVTVLDNGIGMTREVLERLFNGYYTTEGTVKERGTGLGLMLCREVIEKHGGKIRIESELNKGSKFIFTLPGSC